MKKRNKIAVSVLAGILAIGCCFTGISLAVTAENARVTSLIEIPETAYVGEKISVPETVETDGSTKNADVKITAPDGSTYTGKEIVLNSAGKYVFEYFVNGRVVKTDTCMCVRRPQDFFETNKFAECIGVEEFQYDNSYKGLKYSVSKGAEISFSRELDMTEFTKDDVLLELLVEPSVMREADFGNYTITFTDVEDENSTLSLYMTDSTLSACDGMATYVRAGGNGQLAGGWAYSGSTYKFETISIYGTPLRSSFRAIMNSEQLSLKLFYDDEEHAVYGSYGFDYRTLGKILIADLDDVSVFGSSIWEGFTSGKVRMSITFDGFNSDKNGTFMLLQCGGFDLSQESFSDTKAPEITVDFGGEKGAPDSVVGYTYTIFDAFANDDFDETVTVETNVRYTNPVSNISSDVTTDGKTFKTNRNGIYTITYTACDLSGNRATEEVTFFCAGEERVVCVETTEEPRTVSLYDKVTVVGTESVTAWGGNGSLDVTCRVYDPDGKETELTQNSFVPTKIGTYYVTYSATDYFGVVGEAKIAVEVKPLTKPVFINGAQLPRVLISGFTYELPQLDAKECVGNSISDAEVEAYVNGTKTKGSFIAPSTEVATITYKAAGKSGTSDVLTYTVPVVNGNGGKDQAAYFYTDALQVTEAQSYVELSAKADGSAVFANPLNAASFSVDMAFADDKTNFEALYITLQSVKNPSQTLTFRLHFDGKNITLETPDGTRTALDKKGDSFSLKFNNSDLLILDCNNVSVGLARTDDDGNAFTGFDGAVWAEFRFVGVTGDSALRFTGLNNQNLGYRKANAADAKDDIEPQIVLGGEYVYKQMHRDTLTIYSANAYDVLGEIKQFTVRVTAPDGTTVLQNLSAADTYEVQLDQIGVYRIVYTAVDSNGNTANAGATVEATDNTPPELNVNLSKIKTICKVGTKVELPKITVSDDTDSVYYDVYLQMPDNALRLLVYSENGNERSFISEYGSAFAVGDRSFKLNAVGKYILTVMAYDGNFNFVTSSVEITVVE